MILILNLLLLIGLIGCIIGLSISGFLVLLLLVMNLLRQPVLRIRRRSHALLGLQSTVPENQLLIKLAHPPKPLIGSPRVNEIENLDIDQPKHGYHE